MPQWATTAAVLLDMGQAPAVTEGDSEQTLFLGQWVGHGLPLRAQGLAEHQFLLRRLGQVGETEHAAAHQQVDHILKHPDQVDVQITQIFLHLGIAPVGESLLVEAKINSRDIAF